MSVYLDTPSTLYPNPVQDKLTVLVGGDSAIVDLTIYDIQGINAILKKFSSMSYTVLSK